MTALYNEWEPYPAAWLRNLIAAGHIAPGRVDERSIVELRATDLVGVVQFHAFAGIAVWGAALRAAGWPDDRPVWTASLPCQPFSQAGSRRGFDDERHLWPVYFELVRECRPVCILGEQSASKDGRAWLDAVSADLEGAGYAVAAVNTCAAGVGAPHIRQRMYWCAVRLSDSEGVRRGTGRDGHGRFVEGAGPADGSRMDASAGAPARVDGRMADADGPRLARRSFDAGRGVGGGPSAERGSGDGLWRLGHADGIDPGRDGGGASRAEAACSGEGLRDGPLGDEPCASGADGRMGDTDGRGRDGERVRLLAGAEGADRAETAGTGGRGGRRDPWAEVEWLACSDGKLRPTKPGLRPLAPRTPGGVGQVRAYGNGLNFEQAATFVEAVMDVLDARRAA